VSLDVSHAWEYLAEASGFWVVTTTPGVSGWAYGQGCVVGAALVVNMKTIK
jgi:hypothetical protein